MLSNKHSDSGLIRCAIYTRKSTQRGLEQEVNSLEAQRDVCSAYIKCQGHRKWMELPSRYDDGGYSGGTLVRPALQRLLSDIEAGRVDIIVIYKIDRLTRSMSDFVRLIDAMDRHGTGFVSVTQSFDTSDSMGRLVLNVLLTFAQFERELMGDRIRDKNAALRRRGKYICGNTPLGYARVEGRLVVDPLEAQLVQEIFRRYPIAESGRQLLRELESRGIVSRCYVSKRSDIRHGGKPICIGTLQRMISNPVYLGFVVHEDAWIKAEHDALITREEWDAVQVARSTRYPVVPRRDPGRNILLGILCDEQGRMMKIDSRAPEGKFKAFRYYFSEKTRWASRRQIKRVRVDADQTEEFTKTALQAFLNDRPEVGKAIMSLGLYSPEIKRLLKVGGVAACRINRMSRLQLRQLFKALIVRAEVSHSELRLFISCHELARYLGWDELGIFERRAVAPKVPSENVYLIQVPGFLIREHRRFAIPITPSQGNGIPNLKLIALLTRASNLRALVLQNRQRSPLDLARDQHIGPSYFSRLLKLNYLAPDIQTAIIDGTHPPSLTPQKLAYAALPLDWEHQRQLLGFC